MFDDVASGVLVLLVLAFCGFWLLVGLANLFKSSNRKEQWPTSRSNVNASGGGYVSDEAATAEQSARHSRWRQENEQRLKNAQEANRDTRTLFEKVFGFREEEYQGCDGDTCEPKHAQKNKSKEPDLYPDLTEYERQARINYLVAMIASSREKRELKHMEKELRDLGGEVPLPPKPEKKPDKRREDTPIAIDSKYEKTLKKAKEVADKKAEQIRQRELEEMRKKRRGRGFWKID